MRPNIEINQMPSKEKEKEYYPFPFPRPFCSRHEDFTGTKSLSAQLREDHQAPRYFDKKVLSNPGAVSGSNNKSIINI